MYTVFRGFILLLIVVVAAFASTTNAETAPQIPLPKLATDRFGKLSLAEEMLARAVANGETADRSELSGEDRIIRGELLSWLCTNPDATARVTYRGISISGAQIIKETNLEWAKIPFPLSLVECVFLDVIFLNHGHIAALDLSGSSVPALDANAIRCDGDVDLRFGAIGTLALRAAKIDGNLSRQSERLVVRIRYHPRRRSPRVRSK